MSESFGKYQLIDRIAVGGMAEVYLARSVGAEGVEKTLVIKKILPELASDARFVEMFIAEAKIAMGLNHPNVVQIYDFGKVGQDYYLAMEHVDGVDLGRLLRAGQRATRALPLGDALFVAIEIARALDYAHRRTNGFGQSLEIVHRDVSPQNVLISREGAVKLLDFGIARATSVHEDRPGLVTGKYRYMSPEQAHGEPVDQRSDVFSLGVVMFELFCGRPLFRAQSTDDVLSLVKNAVVPDIHLLAPALPSELEHLLYKTLSVRRDERPESTRELQRAMTRVLYGLDEIHDEVTLAQHLRDVSSGLVEREADARAPRVGLEESSSTVVGRTRVARAGASHHAREASGDLQTTPALARSRKEVVTIAGRLEGLGELQRKLSAERWQHLVAEMTRILDAIAFKNEGALHRVDARGFVIVLGVPVSSDNDAVRAARVAHDLHEAVVGMNFSLDVPLHVCLGIATSEVVIEHHTGGLHRGYRWHFLERGAAPAEALAKMALARETVIGSQVHQRVRREFHCEAIRPVVGGDYSPESSEGAKAFRLKGPKSARDRIRELRRAASTFYGRDVERRVLRQAYRRVAMDRVAGAVILMGPAGVGKSTLMEDFLSGLAATGQVRVLRAVASPDVRDLPLGSAAAFFAEALQLGPRHDLRQLATRLEQVIATMFADEEPEERELIFDSMAAIFGVPVADRAFVRLEREERERRTFLSLGKVVTAFASAGPVVVAIDDMHHVDPVMLEFTARYFASEQSVPVLMVGTARDAGPHTEVRAWKHLLESRFVARESVGELRGGQAERLVRDLLRLEPGEGDELVARVLHQTGGNPLYIHEVVEALGERKVELPASLGGDEDWLPASVEGIIAANLDRLELEARAVLLRLALLGTSFSAARAQSLLGQPCEGALDALVEAGFLRRLGPGTEGRFGFCNALTREVAARCLLPEEAAELHAKIAADLIAHRGQGAAHSCARIARHLEAAGDLERARSYYVSAAREAARLVGAEVCVRLCDRVLELAPVPDEERLSVLLLKEEASQELGDEQGARSALAGLRRFIEECPDCEFRVDVWLRHARYDFQQGDFRSAREHLERAENDAVDLEDAISLAQVARLRAVIELSEGRREGALAVVEKGLLTLDQAPTTGASGRRAGETAVQLHNVRGVVLRQTGRHREALIAYERALSRARQLELPRQERQILMNSGLALAYVGRFTEALERYEHALVMCRRLGHRRDEALLLVNIGHVSYLLGQTPRAIAEIQRALHLARRTSTTATEADGQVSLGLCFLELGRLQEAEQALHEGLRLADSIPHAYLAVCATLALAQVKLAGEEAADAAIALVQAEDARERSEQADMRWGRAFALSLMARAYLAMGAPLEALARSRQALALLDAIEIYGEDEVNVYHARIVAACGDQAPESEGREALQRARAVLDERAAGIADPALREAYLARPLSQMILLASTEG
ncbi:hypothetical protein DL240_02425 [Lujinxingia litoralis]|uniref:non-specific serine/threonine protein kinase n=1 Tax=Lujinxingia litoralis TaxID=2211119 RepID=A0A328CBV5_9DELT|nr:serine/threonine-protein kinase [Lujinxingia litoralis]RAL25090.1 hypothetical protein DL240_02425 [Lujinxingia litoralis]